MKKRLQGAQKFFKKLTKQEMKARAGHPVQCSVMPGRRRINIKPLSELYVNGQFTEDREDCQKTLQRLCEEVFTDHDETRSEKKRRIEYFKRKGDQHFTDDGRRAEIAVDLVPQARAKTSENKVHEPEDAVVSEMIK